MSKKKPIISPLGQWAHPGEVTIIPSSKITMKGVNYPVLGVDDLGNSKVMMPGAEYNFPGNYVTEYPQMSKGGQMIKRKDGSYSQRGLWDNIRANKGSGKKPTKQMLEQERKIKAKMKNGGWLDQFQTGGMLPPIYTSNPRDPRLRSYNDSLNLYKKGERDKQKYINVVKDAELSTNRLVTAPPSYKTSGKIAPIAEMRLNPKTLTSNFAYYEAIPGLINGKISTSHNWTDVISNTSEVGKYLLTKKPLLYKKPVQPYIYKKPEVSPIYTSDINDPRLKAYNDSLSLHNLYTSPSKFNSILKEIKTNPDFRYYRPSTKEELNSFPGKIKPIGGTEFDFEKLNSDIVTGKNTKHSYYPVYDKNGKTVPNLVGTDSYFKKPVQPYIYRKPEVTPEIVETPVPVVEPPKPSLAISNIDRDMYTPGGGMGREYNIGVTLQDGSKKAFRTEKEYQDWKEANNLDISNAKVTEGKGYSYNYPENKKYGGWLDTYQSGGSIINAIKIAMTPELRGFVGNQMVDKGVSKVAQKVGDVSKQQLFERYRPVDYPDPIGAIFNIGKDVPLRDLEGDYHVSEEAWRLALGLPTESKYISPSKYKPSKANDPNAQYYSLNNVYDPQKLINAYIEKAQGKPGQSVQINALSPYLINKDRMVTDNEMPFTETDPLQNFTLSQGEDEKGRYVSIYDKYDFNVPYMDDVVYGSNRKPYEFYDRFYYKKDANGRPIYVKQRKNGGQTSWLNKYK